MHAELLGSSGELALVLMPHQLGLGVNTRKARVLRGLSKRDSSQRAKAKFSSSILHCLGKHRNKRLFGALVLRAKEIGAVGV